MDLDKTVTVVVSDRDEAEFVRRAVADLPAVADRVYDVSYAPVDERGDGAPGTNGHGPSDEGLDALLRSLEDAGEGEFLVSKDGTVLRATVRPAVVDGRGHRADGGVASAVESTPEPTGVDVAAPTESASGDAPDPEGPSDRTTAAGVEGAGRRMAVCVVAPEATADAVARTVSRARRRGLDVFVASFGDDPSVEFAAELGAVVFPFDPQSADEAVSTALEVVARDRSYDGVIRQSGACEPIDYDRSVRDLNAGESFAVDAVPVTATDGEALTVVGIPAFDEEATIEGVVREAAAFADLVVVVDDGSSDDTADRAERAGAIVVRHGRNRGYGAALRTLFQHARRLDVDSLAVLDADGQHSPDDLPRLFEAQRSSGADVVIGSRFVDGAETDAPLYRRFGIGVINVLMNLSTGTIRSRSYIRDTQSGFRVYNRDAIESLAADPTIGEGMNASTDIIFHARRNGYVVEEVPARVNYDVANPNSQNPVTHGLDLVKNIFVTMEQQRPITMLGVPGFLSLLVGLSFGYWSLQNYLASSVFPLGLGLTAVLFTMVGTFAYFTAILLHAVNHASRPQ